MYVVTGVNSGKLTLAPATAPLNLIVEVDPGTMVTVVNHLIPTGTVLNDGKVIDAASDDKGIGVPVAASVVRVEADRVYVDPLKATPGTPYGQYTDCLALRLTLTSVSNVKSRASHP